MWQGAIQRDRNRIFKIPSPTFMQNWTSPQPNDETVREVELELWFHLSMKEPNRFSI